MYDQYELEHIPSVFILDDQGNIIGLSEGEEEPLALLKKYAEYKDKMHFVILSVDDNEQEPARFIQSKGYTFPAAYGDHQALGRAYGIDAIPASY